MLELHTESSLFNIYQHISASNYSVRFSVSHDYHPVEILGCFTFINKHTAIFTTWHPDFSPSSQAFSEPHEDFCRLGSAAWHGPRSQAPCFFGFQNPSSPKPSVAADFQRMPYQHCSTKIRRNAFSSIWGWLRTLLVLPFAFIISQKWGMKLTLLVLLCFLQSHQGLVWRNTSLPTFPLFLAHIIKYLSQLSNLLSVFLYRILCSKRTGNFTYPLPHPQYPEEHQDKTGIHKLIKTNWALWC